MKQHAYQFHLLIFCCGFMQQIVRQPPDFQHGFCIVLTMQGMVMCLHAILPFCLLSGSVMHIKLDWYQLTGQIMLQLLPAAQIAYAATNAACTNPPPTATNHISPHRFTGKTVSLLYGVLVPSNKGCVGVRIQIRMLSESDNFWQIQKIYRIVSVTFGFAFCYIKLSFIIHCHPSFTLNSYLLMSVSY